MGRLANGFNKHKWWLLTVLVATPLAAVAAGVPNIFTSGTVISSQQVNDNFKNLADRVTALEAAKATTITVVVDNLSQASGLTSPILKSFTTTGGAVSLVVSGSAYTATAGVLDVAVSVDTTVIGHLKGFTNEPSSHKSLSARLFQAPANLAPGNHVVSLSYGMAGTTADTNDYFSVTVIETR